MGLGVEYTCPNCMRNIMGQEGQEVLCRRCNKRYETDWEYTEDNTIRGWLTKEIKK